MSTLGSDFDPGGSIVRRTVELIPEPGNPHDRYAVSVRASNYLLGYLARERAILFHSRLMDLINRGLVPTVPAAIRAYDQNRWDDTPGTPVDLSVSVEIQLSDPHLLTPGNEPPEIPYTLLPPGSSVQVTKVDDHFDVLRRFVEPEGELELLVTLHELDVSTAKTDKWVVEIRVDGHRIGQLTPQSSAKFLPAIRHLDSRGLVTVGRGWFRGSSVSAQVSLLAAKSHELPEDFLTGEPQTVISLNRPRRTPVVMGGAQSVAADSTPTFSIDMDTSRPLTPWQQKEATKLLLAASAEVGLRGFPASEPYVSTNSIKAVVLESHSEEILAALAGVEESDFSLANRYRSVH
ncbi:hypothetical protein [Rhodococcus sp. IEGM 1379]|uniref:hypothetical protein n=1 Tax=Rhodococcus sp. IEGM 1379 TaxID=3047086 RepID=UPI0024B66A8F|nr:hypothetical protein [Rhodococcus sp. IEGM 1379]MDI9918462.1 hypothetical protein [Rhodococcus sp. IEGM 1379]